MAEGWARSLKGSALEPYSAGTEPRGVDPLAIKVMAEAGVDMSGQSSKPIESLKHIQFDYVMTLCDDANGTCPFFPGLVRKQHVGFDDPPRLARAAATEAGALTIYRRVRDEIRAFIETLPDSLEGG